MSPASDSGARPWSDALLAASLFAIDPWGPGGIRLRARAGAVRDAWLGHLTAGLLPEVSVRRIPLHASADSLFGGLDLAASLEARRPVRDRGLIARCDGGIGLLAMAERIEPRLAARLANVLDTHEVCAASDAQSARVGLVALDEGAADDEATPAPLADRLAYWIDLGAIASVPKPSGDVATERLADARALLPRVAVPDELVTSLCSAALALGIVSLRAPILAARVARVHAAFCLRDVATVADAEVAARVVLGPRALQCPPPAAEDRDAEDTPPEHDPEPDTGPSDSEPTSDHGTDVPDEDRIIAAAKAALPPGVLANPERLSRMGATAVSGRAGAARISTKRGRPLGARPGHPRSGARVDILATIKAAVPWQRVRATARGERAGDTLHIRREDFHVKRFKERTETVNIFLVDASGSTAAQRLGEAKGAVELLLAQCYVRRDQVALLAFRGKRAELLLPPTRSLARAKRCLAELPGGGGTPLASAIAAGAMLADAVRRKKQFPHLILLTDGSANIARDGVGDRARGESDALAAAQQVRAAGIKAVLVDTSQRPRAFSRTLADAMAARWLALPRGDAATLAAAVVAEAT